jgi:hypothetical protein
MPRGVSRYDEVAFQQRLWTPQALEVPIAAWYDGSDLSTIQTSTGISQWKDNSVNGKNATQVTGASQPILQNLAIGIWPAVSFDGSKFLNTTLSASSTAETVIAICRANSGTTRTLFGSNVAGGRQFRVETNGQLAFFRQNQVQLAASGVGNTINLNTNILIGMTYDNTETRFYTNGAQLGAPTTITPALVAGCTTDIGINSGLVAEQWSGLMGEILVFQSVLSDYHRQLVEGYLCWKWGIEFRLTSDHPFTFRPPTIGS